MSLESDVSANTAQPLPWKLLVVDDEPEVHLITKMVLQGYRFEGRGLVILEATSAEQAKTVLRNHSDTAVILLDVVMETDHSGLDLVRWIRNDLKNSLVRIILRTGQPGSAPEKQVIVDYEINDYKSKTELTSIKLFTAVTAAIRAWRDLRAIQRSKEGFKKIILATGSLYSPTNVATFIEGVLTQLTSLLYCQEDALYLQSEGLAVRQGDDGLRIVAATGSFEPWRGQSIESIPDEELRNVLREALSTRSSVFRGSFYMGYFAHGNGQQHLVVLKTSEALRSADQEIIELFSSNVAAAFELLSGRWTV